MMLFALPIASAFLASTVSAQLSASLDNVTQAFTQAKVVPDVLSSFSPRAILNVTFNATTPVNVTPGILLSEEQTASEPQFFFLANVTIPPNITYTLALVDPDAPTPQNTSISQFRHFLGGGFTVDSTGLLKNNTAALSDFVPPTPPTGSDPHRYVMLAYLQPPNFNSVASNLVNASTDRTNFNITAFASAAGLGEPLAGNFFFTGPSNSTGTGTAPQPTDTSPGNPGNGASEKKQIMAGMAVSLGLLLGILLSEM